MAQRYAVRISDIELLLQNLAIVGSDNPFLAKVK